MAIKMGFEPKQFKKPHNKYGNHLVTVVVDGRTIHFKSKLEYGWANHLELLKRERYIRDWSYETHTFRFDNIGLDKWKVDFVIRNLDDSFEYHECKGFLKKRDIDKLKLLFKERPETKLTYIFAYNPKIHPNKMDWIKRVCQRVITNGNTIIKREPKLF